MTTESADELLARIGPAYAALRTRVTAFVGDAVAADPSVATRPVPACPDWRVRDVLAHLAGTCEDILAGNLDGVATDPWTAAQVARHADTDVTDLLAAWNTAAEQVEPLVPHFPPAPAAQWVFDATTHEHDLRGALDVPGGRDSDAVGIAVGFILDSLGAVIDHGRLPSLEVRTDRRTWQAGPTPPQVRIEASEFEVMRTFGGRRTPRELRALAVEGDPDPLLAFFAGGPLKPCAESLQE